MTMATEATRATDRINGTQYRRSRADDRYIGKVTAVATCLLFCLIKVNEIPHAK